MAFSLISKEKDLGGFTVKRILPHAEKRTVGPFVFFDHMGPANFPAGSGINVRPHPHIGLATLTYLFEGCILHQDSLGSIQEIKPGDVNWMTAGRGIVHSERETLEVRSQAHRLNGLQSWIALPKEKADIEPSFVHAPKAQLPCIYDEKVMMRVVVGDAFGTCSPVKTHSPMFYVDVCADSGATVNRPAENSETAVYLQSGSAQISGEVFSAGDFIIWENSDTSLVTIESSRFIILGGEAFDHPPFLDWNFVSFDKSKIVEAKKKWAAGEFPKIPSDAKEYIPLPA